MPQDRTQLTIPAAEVQPGDELVGMPVERDYTVTGVARVLSMSAPEDVYAAGGWVNLIGDTEDGYYARFYEAEQEYYAAPDQMVTVRRTV